MINGDLMHELTQDVPLVPVAHIKAAVSVIFLITMGVK